MVASIQSVIPAVTKDLGTSAVSPPVKSAALLARVTPMNARRLTPSLSERGMLPNCFSSMATIVQECSDASKQKQPDFRLHLYRHRRRASDAARRHQNSKRDQAHAASVNTEPNKLSSRRARV